MQERWLCRGAELVGTGTFAQGNATVLLVCSTRGCASVETFPGRLLGPKGDYFYSCFKNNLGIGHRTCPRLVHLLRKINSAVTTQEEKANVAPCFDVPLGPEGTDWW